MIEGQEITSQGPKNIWEPMSVHFKMIRENLNATFQNSSWLIHESTYTNPLPAIIEAKRDQMQDQHRQCKWRFKSALITKLTAKSFLIIDIAGDEHQEINEIH